MRTISFFELGRGAEVEIGRYCSLVGAIIATNGKVSIGDYTFIAHEVVIADEPWARPSDQRKPSLATGPRLGSDVWVGMRAVIIEDVTVGDGAVVAAHAVVSDDVAPYSVVAGNPAVVVRRGPRPAG